MKNSENILDYANYKVENTKYYNIHGERILDLGKDKISAIINFYNLPKTQKETINVITDLPQVKINNIKYYAFIHKKITILVKSSVLDVQAEKNLISSEEIFGYSYFKDINELQKNINDSYNKNKLNNFIFICNTDNLINFYDLDIPNTGCILVLNNRRNSGTTTKVGNLMSICDIAKLCYKENCYFILSQFFSKSVVSYLLKSTDTKYSNLYREIFNFVNKNNIFKTPQYTQKFKLLISKMFNKHNFGVEQKLFLISLYYGYIKDKIHDQEKINDIIKLLQHFKINVANENSNRVISIQEDFVIGNYAPNQEDIKSITFGINKFDKNNYVDFKKVLLKSNK